MNPDEAYDRIVASLYRSARDDAHWPVAGALIEEARAPSATSSWSARGPSMRAREIAAATGWRENYVRWLIQQVYRKQGVSGQAALVRQVLAADALPGR